MADWPPVIDADGHVLERQSDIRKYPEPPWDRRNTGLWPSSSTRSAIPDTSAA